jgi:hypothetical protein
MIRKADAIERGPHAGRINREPAVTRGSAVTDGVRSSLPAPNRTGVERALGDAFSIAQMSQNIIQRAMTISFQLKSIAANALASGKINTNELSTTLSEMRSTLGRYGEQVAAPAQTALPSSVKLPEMPDISDEMKSLREISAGFHEGRFNAIPAINGVISRLGDKLTASVTAGDSIAGLMKGSSEAVRLEHPAQPGAIVTQLKEAIVSNPGNALAAQGNINYLAADRLMA